MPSFIRDMKNLDLFNNKITDVSQHFSQKNHNFKTDFQFLFYAINLKEDERKGIESDLINTSKCLKAKIMITQIPSLNLIKYFSYL